LAQHACGTTASQTTEASLRPDLSIIEGPYLRDVLDQPRALEQTCEGLATSPELDELAARLRKRDFHRVVLTGMGSSFHALHPLNLDLIAQRETPIMVETSELVHYQSALFDPQTLIVAVSQSGRSAEMIRLLEINNHRAAIIGVTNTIESPLAEQSNASVLTNAGKEFSVSCKTYVAALMALQWLSDILLKRDRTAAKNDLAMTSSAVASYLNNWKGHVQQARERLQNIRHLFFVGRGRSLAAVSTAALIVKESDRFLAEGMSSAAFRHGPFEMLNDETFVLVFAGDPKTRDLNYQLLQDIRAAEGLAEFVSEDSDIAAFRLPAAPSSVSPILEILPAQIITLALASLNGSEPGRFALASKVTTIE
jgi:glucosamine--fructose-6-phosphate aminotransferase (isomerizing)